MEITEQLKEIGELLRTQDNRITESPMFCVQVNDRVHGLDKDYGDGIEWIDLDDVESGIQPAPENPDETKLTAFGYRDNWKTVLVCFTEEGCKEHLRQNQHNYRYYDGFRIYVESFYRCPEMKAVREFLMTLDKPLKSNKLEEVDKNNI